MEGLSTVVTTSVLTRLLAALFLFSLLMGGVVVAIIDLVNSNAINPIVYNLLFVGAGFCLAVLGINFGVMLTPIQNKTTNAKTTTTALTTGTTTTNTAQP